jgi:hypothetical protein
MAAQVIGILEVVCNVLDKAAPIGLVGCAEAFNVDPLPVTPTE